MMITFACLHALLLYTVSVHQNREVRNIVINVYDRHAPFSDYSMRAGFDAECTLVS